MTNGKCINESIIVLPKKFFLAKIQAIKIPGIKIIKVDVNPIFILRSKAFNSKSVNHFPLN
tara:strand:+ start:151 stop:333 length:183 start_codon:yes stop_codon:yes gene_type:complete